MKLLIIVDNITNTFDACIPSRDLSAEEVQAISDLVGAKYGTYRTVHFAECGDHPAPFLDIMEYLKVMIKPDVTHQELVDAHPSTVSSLRGVPVIKE